MNRKISKLLLLFALPLLIGAAEFADYTTLINQKMETERRLEEHLGGIVGRIVGQGKSTVIVSVQTTDLKKSRVLTEQWLEKEKDKLPAPPQQEEFLPGIPMKSRVVEKEQAKESPEKSGGKRVEDILTLPSEFIESIRVSLVLDKSIPDDVVATVENVVNDVLDLRPARGDRLTIQRVDFAGKSIDFMGFLFNPYFYVIMLVLSALAVTALFLFGPLKRFLFAALQTLKDLKAMKTETEYKGGVGGGGGGGGVFGAGAGFGEGEFEIEEDGGTADAGKEEETAEGEETEEEEFEKMTYQPLKFLEDKDLRKLAYLLNFEKPEVAALLISYLEPAKGARVMAAIPHDKRTQIAKRIVKIQRTSREIMQHIDDFLSKKIDYVTGGSDKLVSMLEVMNEEEREEILKTISEDDPEFAEKIKSRIFSFDDIIKLDDTAIQVIIQELDTKDLGVALKKSAEDIREKFIANMSEGAAALLKEEIEFGRQVTEGQIKEKQLEIVRKLKELEEQGIISGLTGAAGDELWDEELGEEEREGVLEDIIKAAQEAIAKKETMEQDAAAEAGDTDEVAFQYYEQGLQAYKQEDYEQAVEFFSKSIEYNSRVWQTYQYLGSCYLALGDESSAKQAYSKSLELNPENSELRQWLETH